MKTQTQPANNEPAAAIAATLDKLSHLRRASRRADRHNDEHGANHGSGPKQHPMSATHAVNPASARRGPNEFPELVRGGPKPLGRTVGSPDDARAKREFGVHRALDILGMAETPMSISELGLHMGVDQPRASRLVQALQDKGFVERQQDPADARRAIVIVTELGSGYVRQRMASRAAPVAVALEALTDEERTELSRLLDKLAQAWPKPE